jgi:hypothetical protein
LTAKTSTRIIANQKFGDRDAELGGAHHGQVGGRVAAGCGKNSSRECDQGRKRQRIERQRQGDHHPLGYEFGNRHPVGIGNAEIALQQTRYPAEIPKRQRLIEAELGPQGGDGLGISIDAHHEGRRIAGDHFHHQENDQAGGNQAERQGQEAPKEIGGHRARSRGALSRGMMARWPGSDPAIAMIKWLTLPSRHRSCRWPGSAR